MFGADATLSSTDQLFDDTPYIDPSKIRRARITKPKPEPVAVTIGDQWVQLANGRGVHRLRRSVVEGQGTGLCGAVGSVLTIPAGVVAGGCAKCLAAMNE